MTKLPRVLLLTNSLAVGGAETQLVRLALHLHGAGYPVMVATILPDGRGRPDLETAGIPHEVLPLVPPVGGITVLTGAIRLIRRWNPDIVLSFLFYANLLGRLAGAITRVPIVISSVRNERFGGRASDLAMRVTDRLATVTVTNSRNAARRLVADRIVPPSRLVVIPNGVEVEPDSSRIDRSGLRRVLGLNEGDFLWLAAGRLEPQKDYPTLLRAMARLREDGRSSRLVIAGEGSQRSAIEDLVRELGLLSSVRLLGLRNDIPSLLAAADALVLSSRWEGLPNIVLEAFASGLPVVASSCGGTPEIVEPAVTGLLVPPEEPEALASAMLELMRYPPNRRSAIGAAGRAFVERRFTTERIMHEWEGLIDDLWAVPLPSRPRAAANSLARGA